MLSPQGLHKWFALFNDGFSDRVTGTIALRFLFSKYAPRHTHQAH